MDAIYLFKLMMDICIFSMVRKLLLLTSNLKSFNFNPSLSFSFKYTVTCFYTVRSINIPGVCMASAYVR